MTKVILADDHHMVRKGLRSLLSNEKDFEIVGEASTGPEALDLARNLQPEILILDIMMPGFNGLEVTSRLAMTSPEIRIVILSMHRNEAYVYEALRSGAKAYVLKDDSADELITAIRQVKSGLCYLSSSLQLQSAKPFGDITDNANFDPLEQLTAREKEILYLAVKGLANADTATKLGISRRTVETHSRHFMHKLGLSNRSQLIQFAIRHGISSKDKISNANL